MIAEIARPGDWIEEPSSDHSAPRRGLVVEVLGSGSRRHYRVRWDEQHESIHFPSPFMRVHPPLGATRYPDRADRAQPPRRR